jgi:hypothetical protein
MSGSFAVTIDAKPEVVWPCVADLQARRLVAQAPSDRVAGGRAEAGGEPVPLHRVIPGDKHHENEGQITESRPISRFAYDVPVHDDRALGRNERIVFQAGTHNVTMSVAYADFERMAGPTVADIAVARST